MGIKRNEVAEPQWDMWDYADISKADMFSAERWKTTVNWNIILKQIEIARHASQMIDISLYPSKLFFAAIDLLEAHMLVLDDLFYRLTGLRLIGAKPKDEFVNNALGFWNMDCYKELEQIHDGLVQIRIPLIKCLKHEPIWDVSLKVGEKRHIDKYRIGPSPIPVNNFHEERAYTYACAHYEETEINKEALATQIANILQLAVSYSYFFNRIYKNHLDFSKLLVWFRQSETAQIDYIEPWRHDYGGTRDSLIAKMEKDPKLAPWVHRYDHLSKDESVSYQLFYSDEDSASPINKEECYNTDNWISILTVAAVLQEYDEQNNKPIQNKEHLLDMLSLCFKDEVTAERFLNKIQGMRDKDIITKVKKEYDAGLCIDKSINLWRLLYEAKLYTATFSNWNKQLNKGLKK